MAAGDGEGDGDGVILRYSFLCGLRDPAEHLRFVNPCSFRTLDRFKHSWLATAADIWNGLPADLILQGEACGWRTILKDVQRCICT